jgi:hypothetical protein
MEKKGELVNQLAIISDLIEKMNLEKKSNTLVLELNENIFYQTFEYINKKQNSRMNKPDKTFTIKIGLVDIVFNKSSA